MTVSICDKIRRQRKNVAWQNRFLPFVFFKQKRNTIKEEKEKKPYISDLLKKYTFQKLCRSRVLLNYPLDENICYGNTVYFNHKIY